MDILIETWRTPDKGELIINVRYSIDQFTLLHEGNRRRSLKTGLVSIIEQISSASMKFLIKLVLSSGFDSQERTAHVMQRPRLTGVEDIKCIEAEIVE